MLRELNRVIDYIEDHLCDEALSLAKIADYAGVSDYHFRQIFFHLSGYSLSQYIKYRRLSNAGFELLQGVSVTELAYKYGYQSLDGFSRAFSKWSGILPSEAAQHGLSKSFPKITFTITITGGNPMEFRLDNKPAFFFAGVSRRVPMQFEGVNQAIVKLAESITEEQRSEMRRLQNLDPQEIVNVSYEADANFLKEEGHLTHMIGVLTTREDISAQLDKIAVAAHTWAVFPNEGPFPETLQNTMAQIYADWLPSSNYELVKAPTFSFTKMDSQKDNYAYSEIWLAVTPR